MFAMTTGPTMRAMSVRHLAERSISAETLTCHVVSGYRKNIGGAAMRMPVHSAGVAGFTSSQH